MKVSALLVNYNSGAYLLQCARSFLEEGRRAGVETECVVVDNASPQDQEPWKREALALGARWIDMGWNSGYACGVNRAARESTGGILLVVNPDVKFLPGSLSRLLQVLSSRPRVGAVGPTTWWNPARTILFPPNIPPSLKDALFQTLAHLSGAANRAYSMARTRLALPIWRAGEPVEVETLSGGCALFSRDLWEETGGFDERFPLYFEDTDWFRRVRSRGYSLLQAPGADVVHFFNRSGITDGEAALSRYWTSRRRFLEKYYGLAGRLVADWTKALIFSSRAERFRARPMDFIHDLGKVGDPPTIRLGRPCTSFLLELTQDPGFFMAGAIFGQGDCWTPCPGTWEAFGPSRYFLRGLDVSGGEPRYLGTWSFERV